MSVLSDVTLLRWLLLLVALAAFAGPGLALAGWGLRVNHKLDFTQQLIVGFALSLGMWAVLFSALNLVNVALPPISGWLLALAGWLAYGGLLRYRRGTALPPLTRPHSLLPTSLLWLVVAATAVVSLWALRNVVVQPGSDGYHHTLFAQTIAEQGKLPATLAPLTPVLTFTYHFGYHVLVAVLNWMTGISVIALTPIVAQLLKAGMALAAAFTAEALGARRSGSVVTAAAVGLICVFPAYYVNWGRNTQLTGLLLLAVLLGIVWLWCSAPPRWPTAGLLAVLAVGLALAHYRVTLMAAIGCTVVVAAHGWQARWPWSTWRQRSLHIAGMVLGALLLVSPWVWHVWSSRAVGYSAAIAEPQASFFALDRLGSLVLSYPTNWPLLIVYAVALAYGLWRRDLGVWVMTIWAGALYVLSQPWALSQYMDTITIVQSLFLPAAVTIGLAVGLFLAREAGEQQVGRHWLVAGLTLLLSLAGLRAISNIVEPGAPYVLPADMDAAKWVASNTPDDALFMVNTYTFDFAPQFTIGSDAGGWLPVLAKRRVVTAPMSFSIERNMYENYPQRLQQLAAIGNDLTTPEAVAALRKAGVTHVFVGRRGGPIEVDKLLHSPIYVLEYEREGDYVFRLLPNPGA